MVWMPIIFEKTKVFTLAKTKWLNFFVIILLFFKMVEGTTNGTPECFICHDDEISKENILAIHHKFSNFYHTEGMCQTCWDEYKKKEYGQSCGLCRRPLSICEECGNMIKFDASFCRCEVSGKNKILKMFFYIIYKIIQQTLRYYMILGIMVMAFKHTNFDFIRWNQYDVLNRTIKDLICFDAIYHNIYGYIATKKPQSSSLRYIPAATIISRSDRFWYKVNSVIMSTIWGLFSLSTGMNKNIFVHFIVIFGMLLNLSFFYINLSSRNIFIESMKIRSMYKVILLFYLLILSPLTNVFSLKTANQLYGLFYLMSSVLLWIMNTVIELNNFGL